MNLLLMKCVGFFYPLIEAMISRPHDAVPHNLDSLYGCGHTVRYTDAVLKAKTGEYHKRTEGIKERYDFPSFLNSLSVLASNTACLNLTVWPYPNRHSLRYLYPHNYHTHCIVPPQLQYPTPSSTPCATGVSPQGPLCPQSLGCSGWCGHVQ